MCEGRLIIGLIEKIKFENGKECVAKIDTGADSSSVDEGLFELMGIKKKVIAHKYIRSALGRDRRPIVKLNIEFQGMNFEEKFTVSNRSNLRYKVLIGKDILRKEGFMVDPLKDNSEILSNMNKVGLKNK